MDQQNPNQAPAKHVPTEAEIARLEAEAAAAQSSSAKAKSSGVVIHSLAWCAAL